MTLIDSWFDFQNTSFHLKFYARARERGRRVVIFSGFVEGRSMAVVVMQLAVGRAWWLLLSVSGAVGSRPTGDVDVVDSLEDLFAGRSFSRSHVERLGSCDTGSFLRG
jgi:hypothetical protein